LLPRTLIVIRARDHPRAGDFVFENVRFKDDAEMTPTRMLLAIDEIDPFE